MADLNRTLVTYWPCTFCIFFGYLFSPFTLGLSFLLPNLCISEAKTGLIASIERKNRLQLRDKGLLLRYVQGWSMSWLELSVIERNEPAKVTHCVEKSSASERDNEVQTRPSTDTEAQEEIKVDERTTLLQK